MYEENDVRLSTRSGQRCGTDRRKRNVDIEASKERRKGNDRRRRWTVLNEWSSVLKRKDKE